MSLTIFAAQPPLSSWWLSRFGFGPAEWALRSFTDDQAPSAAAPLRRDAQ